MEADAKSHPKHVSDTRNAEPVKSSGPSAPHSTAHPTQDRSSTMRLSKSTPNKEDEFEIPSEPVLPTTFNTVPSPISARPSTSAQSSSGNWAAVIGPKITFKGEIIGEEDLLVQGKVEGSIDLKGNHLTIGQQGVVKANLKAKTITIEGTVEGDLIGQERIEIKASSNVKGNLIAARVTLEDGAKFRGSIDMDSSGQAKISTAAPEKKEP